MLAMLTCHDEFISKGSLSHKETLGPQGPDLGEEGEASRGSKREIQAAKFNQVLKGLDFLHPLT